MHRQSVLIVDDDRSIRTLIRTLLVREEFVVDEAAGGIEALQLIARKQYDAVVLDLMMHDVSGAEVIARMMQSEPRSTPVVIISAGSETMLDAVNAPVIRAKLRKPFDISDLIAAVHDALGNASAPATMKNYPLKRAAR
jgi:two-component system nitrogen regulation response regulator NtrX